jgi:hypothetical protein
MSCADSQDKVVPAPAERPAYRRLALDLLTAALAAIRTLTVADRAFVHRTMNHWLAGEDLASGRDPKAVEPLLPEERAAWAKLWANVRELRDATASPTAPKKSGKRDGGGALPGSGPGPLAQGVGRVAGG